MEEGQCHDCKMSMWDGVYAIEAIFGKYTIYFEERAKASTH